MNSTEENTSISWSTIGDNQPIAHVASADMTFEELRGFGRQVYSVLAAIEWAQAQLLEAGAHGAGMRNMHLLRKAEYEQNHSCAALCGKVAEWSMVYVLAKNSRGICKKCLSMQEFAVSLSVEQESEGEHGNE